jgi:hypothetical protein
MKEFVDLYVHLRHPHHYDPLSWPPALWLSFLWPIPLALLAYRRTAPSALSPQHSALFAFTFFLTLQLLALTFAGIIFISEPLIQMSLFRFSIYPKLLSCIGAAALLLDPTWLARRTVRLTLFSLPVLALIALLILRYLKPTSAPAQFVQFNLPALLLFIALVTAAVAYVAHRPSVLLTFAICLLTSLLLLFHPYLGLRLPLDAADDRDYLSLCHFARDHTPTAAVFVVPPNEQLFRFHAQRAIVVNFKNVPQLSTEMREWKERLEAVLDQPLNALPRRFDRAHAAIAARYDSLPADHLRAVAQRYHAAYVVTARPLPGQTAVFENPSYHLYDAAPKETP